MTINWALEVKSLELNHWLVDNNRLMKEFNSLTFHHIYSELNVEANVLSKLVLGDIEGSIHYSIFSAGSCESKLFGFLQLSPISVFQVDD